MSMSVGHCGPWHPPYRTPTASWRTVKRKKSKNKLTTGIVWIVAAMIRPLAPVHRVEADIAPEKGPKELVIKDSLGQKIEKLCGLSEYQPRVLYITQKKILITHPDQEEISDEIPLVRPLIIGLLYSFE